MKNLTLVALIAFLGLVYLMQQKEKGASPQAGTPQQTDWQVYESRLSSQWARVQEDPADAPNMRAFSETRAEAAKAYPVQFQAWDESR